MFGTHAPLAFPFTVAVAFLASYVVNELLRHGRQAEDVLGDGRVPRARALWLTLGAAAMGLGITSVHFIGMLAYRVREGAEFVPVGYDVPRIVVAALVAVLASGAAVAAATGGPGHLARRVASGLLLGGAIVATHFVAMRAIRVAGMVTYDRLLVTVAGAVALAGGVAMACWMSRPAAPRGRGSLDWLVASSLGAAAVPGTHFIAMAAVRLVPREAPLELTHRNVLATDGLVGMAATITLLVFGLGAIALVLHQQSRDQFVAARRYATLFREADAARHAAEESERRFRSTADSAPVLIWMTAADGACEYVNRAWLEYTGYTPEEALAGGFREGVHPEDRRGRDALLQAPRIGRRSGSHEYRLRRHDGSYGWVIETVVARRAPDDGFSGLIGSCVDITQRKRAEGRQKLALEAARDLSASLDLGTTMRHVTALVVPRLADYCLVHLHEPDGRYRQAAVEHRDPEKRPLLDRIESSYRPNVLDPTTPIARVLATRRPLLAAAADADDLAAALPSAELREIRRALSPVSCMVLPLVARGELLGTLTLVSADPGRRYEDDDLATAELVAARAALAIDNARLYAEARRAGEEAVRAAALEAQLARARLEALRTQLNPHFLFNALNTLTMLVRRGANADALRGIVSLSELLRHALSELGPLEAPLRAEVALVHHYLEIEQLRFRDRLRVSLVLAPEALEALVPSLVLQPLVENAIKHGLARSSDAGRIEIAGRRDEEKLVLEVRDDGPGFPAGWDATSSGGIGIANTRERLLRLYGGRARFEADTAPGGGAVVRVVIPFRTAPEARGAVM